MISNLYFPKFHLPNGFDSADQYLRKLVLHGMKRRYPNDEDSKVRKRIELELSVIEQLGCADYFLIIWDALQYARQQNILIGPGRGSAAGSVVNYCLDITQVDPLKYGLLFERFLTLQGYPSIDIDGDVRLRDEMLCYLPKRYGKNRVAIIENDLCGIIISPVDITRHFDTTIYKNNKGEELLLIKSEVSDVKEAGFLRLNFLTLDSLTVIHHVLENIKTQYKLDINLSQISLDDADTLELYRNGLTASTFVFDSERIRKLLQQMRPASFTDLVALNVLYSPGLLDRIPDFIVRKYDDKPMESPIAEIKTILSETYGLTVYQEQIMQISQTVADFTPEESDKLRKAVMKRKTIDIARFKEQFVNIATKKGYKHEFVTRLWLEWEKWYLFNKSHMVCYTLIAFQTAYLKAHFPNEYMAAYEQCTLNNKQLEKAL